MAANTRSYMRVMREPVSKSSSIQILNRIANIQYYTNFDQCYARVVIKIIAL